MRTALISDIHANLPALTAVLDDIRNSGAEAMACLGDVVGYAAHPRQCVELLRSLECPTVMGNHDFYVGLESPQLDETLSDPDIMAEPVWAGIRLARDELRPDDLAWLRGLEPSSAIDGALIAHAALHDFEDWPYLRSNRKAAPTLEILDGRVGFFGHTHKEAVFKDKRSPAPEQLDEHIVRLPEGESIAVTIGSVGQPRDGDPRARWTLWDPQTRTVEFRRVEYDIQATAIAILSAKLPLWNALRLFPPDDTDEAIKALRKAEVAEEMEK